MVTFPSTAFLLVLWGGVGGWRGVAIKVQEKEEDVEKRRWRKRGERWGEENEVRKEYLI